MSNAVRDENNSTGWTAGLNSDGKTVIRILGNPSTHTLKISDGTTGSDNGPIHALHDENDVPSLLAVSSQTITVNGVNYVQGVTPVAIYSDSSGNLLVNSM